MTKQRTKVKPPYVYTILNEDGTRRTTTKRSESVKAIGMLGKGVAAVHCHSNRYKPSPRSSEVRKK